MPRFSANLSFLFTEVPFLERFRAAADAGFTAVEFAWAYEHPVEAIVAAARTSGVEVVLINAPPGNLAAGDRGLAALPERRAEFRESFATAIRYATALACPRVHVMAGIVAPDAEAGRRRAQHDVLQDNLRWACPQAQQVGITLLLEALNPWDVPNYLYSRQAEVHAVLREVAAPNLKAQMDLYHTQRVEGGVTEKLERYLPDVGHLQIASVPGRHEPDEGELDYAYLFRRIDALGYTGWVGCEYVPRATTTAGIDWRKRLGQR
jgi:hydroxypyruvate isomerase